MIDTTTTTKRSTIEAPKQPKRSRHIGAWIGGLALVAGLAVTAGLVLSDEGASPVPVAPALGVDARDKAAVSAAERYQDYLSGQATSADEGRIQSSERVGDLYGPTADKEEALLQGAKRYQAQFGRTP